MARKQTHSLPDMIWSFIAANPELAAAIAFQIGRLAGEFTSKKTTRAVSRAAQKVPQQLLDALPDGLTNTVLKYLPGPSPRLQPRTARARRRTARSRKAAHAA